MTNFRMLIPFLALAALTACSAPGTPTSPSGSTSPATGTAPFGEVFKVDGALSSATDKIAVNNFSDNNFALNYGVQLLTLPGAHTALIKYEYPAAAAADGTIETADLTRVTVLMRITASGSVFNATWTPDEPGDAKVSVSVAGKAITASFTGTVTQAGGTETHQLEASVAGLPTTKK